MSLLERARQKLGLPPPEAEADPVQRDTLARGLAFVGWGMLVAGTLLLAAWRFSR